MRALVAASLLLLVPHASSAKPAKGPVASRTIPLAQGDFSVTQDAGRSYKLTADGVQIACAATTAKRVQRLAEYFSDAARDAADNPNAEWAPVWKAPLQPFEGWCNPQVSTAGGMARIRVTYFACTQPGFAAAAAGQGAVCIEKSAVFEAHPDHLALIAAAFGP